MGEGGEQQASYIEYYWVTTLHCSLLPPGLCVVTMTNRHLTPPHSCHDVYLFLLLFSLGTRRLLTVSRRVIEAEEIAATVRINFIFYSSCLLPPLPLCISALLSPDSISFCQSGVDSNDNLSFIASLPTSSCWWEELVNSCVRTRHLLRIRLPSSLLPCLYVLGRWLCLHQWRSMLCSEVLHLHCQLGEGVYRVFPLFLVPVKNMLLL